MTVSGKMSKTDCLLDPAHHVYCSQGETSKMRGSEPFGVSRPMAGGDYTFFFFHYNKDAYRCHTVRLRKNKAHQPTPGNYILPGNKLIFPTSSLVCA